MPEINLGTSRCCVYPKASNLKIKYVRTGQGWSIDSSYVPTLTIRFYDGRFAGANCLEEKTFDLTSSDYSANMGDIAVRPIVDKEIVFRGLKYSFNLGQCGWSVNRWTGEEYFLNPGTAYLTPSGHSVLFGGYYKNGSIQQNPPNDLTTIEIAGAFAGVEP